MASTNYDDFAFLRPESEIDILQLPQNAKHHDQATSTFALRFSQALIDPQHGHRFGRNNKRVDVVLDKPGISAVHFRIGFNWTNGQMIVTDTSSNGIVVESFNGEVKQLRQTSTPIFSNDIIQAALIRFRLIIPSHDEEAYNRKWQAYRKSALASLPSLNGLAIQRNFALTMQDSAKLSLLPQEEGELPAIQKAVDCCGTFYAVKRWSKKEEGRQIRELIHPCVTRTFPDKFIDLNEPMLVMEWAIHATLAEQKDVSADQMMTVLIHVLNGAAYIHEQGMAHRAIQPSNILIVSREPMVGKLGGIALSGSLAYKAPEVALRGSYLLSGYSADIWSIGVLTLQYSLFNCWRAHTSEWSSRRDVECQVSRPTWQGLTDIANFMLNPEPRNRPSATDCSTRFSVEQNRAGAMKSEEAQLYSTNLDFLRLQTMIPRVSTSALPLLSEIELQIITTVGPADRLKARTSQILISKRGFHFKGMARRVHYDIEKSPALTLNALAALLEKSRETTDWTDAIDLRRLQQYVEKAHLAEKSDIVGFLHPLDVIRRCSK